MTLATQKTQKQLQEADTMNMKKLIESIDAIEECGMTEMPNMAPSMDMPSEPEDKMSMNVSLNARGDAVEDLIKLMGGAIAPQDAPTSMPMPMPMPSAGPDAHDHEMGDMKKMMKLASDAPEADVEEPEMDAMGSDDPEMEDWDNSPEEEYSDTKTMTKDLSGGINREKKSYKATQDGDNPMAVETSIKEQLWAALNEKMTTEGSRGKKSRGKKSRG